MTLVEALNQQGMKLLLQEKSQQAIEFFQEAIVIDSSVAESHANLGTALSLIGELPAGIDELQTSLQLRPNHAKTLTNLGNVLRMHDQRNASLVALEKAVAISDATEAHLILSCVCSELGLNNKAEYHAQLVLKRAPDNTKAKEILCDIFLFQGKKELALEFSRQLIAENPNNRYVLRQAGVKMMFESSYAEGCKEYEERYPLLFEEMPFSPLTEPESFSKLYGRKWNGQESDHLVIQWEQGLGDTILFLRFVPLAAKRCKKLSLVLQPSLHAIVKYSFEKYENIEICTKHPKDFDYYCFLMSIPYLMQNLDEIPAPPYLFCPVKDSHKRMRVGLVWNSVSSDISWSKNIPFSLFAQLFTVNDVEFVSLQFPLLETLSNYDIEVPSLSSDWFETAKVIETLDLIIAIDSSVAHMAGAMGKKVWLLNKYNTFFFFGLFSETTKWYPEMRIFRQVKMSEWDSVINKVKNELQHVVNRSS